MLALFVAIPLACSGGTAAGPIDPVCSGGAAGGGKAGSGGRVDVGGMNNGGVGNAGVSNGGASAAAGRDPLQEGGAGPDPSAPSSTPSVDSIRLLPASSLTATVTSTAVALAWKLPASGSGLGVEVRRGSDSPPLSPTEGVSVYHGSALMVSDAADTAVHYYSVFAYDSNGNYSPRRSIRARAVALPRGELDAQFGSGGLKAFVGSTYSSTLVNSLTVDRTRVLAIGSEEEPSASTGEGTGDALIWSLSTADGSLVASFADAGRFRQHSDSLRLIGKHVAASASGVYFSLHSETVGTGRENTAVYKLSNAGVLDRTFGEQGAAQAYVTRLDDTVGGNWFTWSTGLALDADGAVLLAARMRAFSGPELVSIWKFSAQGTLDRSYALDGIATHQVGVPEAAETAFVRDTSGFSYLAGGQGETYPAIWKFDRNGSVSLDYGLDNGRDAGVAKVTLPGRIGYSAADAVVDEQQRVTWVGLSELGTVSTHTGVVSLSRINANGITDSGFGDSGALTLVPQLTRAAALARGPSTMLYVCGSQSVGSSTLPSVVRFSADGQLDASFGSGGQFALTLPNSPSTNGECTDLFVDDEEHVYVTGFHVLNSSTNQRQGFVARVK